MTMHSKKRKESKKSLDEQKKQIIEGIEESQEIAENDSDDENPNKIVEEFLVQHLPMLDLLRDGVSGRDPSQTVEKAKAEESRIKNEHLADMQGV